MDEERLKNGGTVLTEKYFVEQLEKIREIRLSERKFYQKITDIYATALDYDRTAKMTQVCPKPSSHVSARSPCLSKRVGGPGAGPGTPRSPVLHFREVVLGGYTYRVSDTI